MYQLWNSWFVVKRCFHKWPVFVLCQFFVVEHTTFFFCHFKLLSLLAHLQMYSFCFPLYCDGPLKVTKPTLLTKWSRQIILDIVTQPLYQQWSLTSKTTVVFFFSPVLPWSSMKASCWQEGEWVLLMCFLDEIHTMFPQLANQPSWVLPADIFTDHVLKNQRSTVLRKIKKGKVKAGQFLFTIFWLLTRLLILCRSSVFGLHFL